MKLSVPAVGLLISSVLALGACGGGSSTPTSPITASPLSPPSLTGTWVSTETPQSGQVETLAGTLSIVQSGNTVTVTPSGGSPATLQISGNTVTGVVARDNGTVICSTTLVFSLDGRTGAGTETCPSGATISISLTKIS